MMPQLEQALTRVKASDRTIQAVTDLVRRAYDDLFDGTTDSGRKRRLELCLEDWDEFARRVDELSPAPAKVHENFVGTHPGAEIVFATFDHVLWYDSEGLDPMHRGADAIKLDSFN